MPECHQLQAVQSSKKKGEIVAMTGDGKMMPAVKEADIGVAMVRQEQT